MCCVWHSGCSSDGGSKSMGGPINVDDDIRDSAGDVGSWNGGILHTVWVHPHSLGDRSGRLGYQSDSGTERGLRAALPETPERRPESPHQEAVCERPRFLSALDF